ERKAIFKIHLEKRLISEKARGNFQMTEDIFDQLADMTEGFIGAELEQIVITALFEAFSEDRSITIEDLEKSIKETIPLSVTQLEQITALREWASVRAVAATPQGDRAEYKEVDQDSIKGKPKDKDVHSQRGGRMLEF